MSEADPGRTREAFQDLARSHLPRLYTLARRLTRDDAEDLVQETLVRAFRSFGTLRDLDAAGGWLQQIMLNALRDRLRKQARSVQEVAMDDVDDFSLYRTIAEEDPFPYSDSLHADFLQAFGREDVREVLAGLPDLYRVPLVLRYMQGYATKEIAGLLDAPLGTVLARLHRGRKLFEKRMWDYAQEAGLLEEEKVR